jgi:hypothetical protein
MSLLAQINNKNARYVYKNVKNACVHPYSTAPQTRRSRVPFPMVLLEIFMDIILPVGNSCLKGQLEDLKHVEKMTFWKI